MHMPVICSGLLMSAVGRPGVLSLGALNAWMQLEGSAGDQALDPLAICNERPFSVTSDGCQKVNHYVNCGKTMTDIIRPQLQKYFGACNEAAMAAPSRAVSQEDHSTCAATLACAREVANESGGVTNIKCLITCTCLHTVPCKGCFIAARTNEQFFFFDLLLARLMPERMPASLVEKVGLMLLMAQRTSK